jgi:hypothetical protein
VGRARAGGAAGRAAFGAKGSLAPYGCMRGMCEGSGVAAGSTRQGVILWRSALKRRLHCDARSGATPHDSLRSLRFAPLDLSGYEGAGPLVLPDLGEPAARSGKFPERQMRRVRRGARLRALAPALRFSSPQKSPLPGTACRDKNRECLASHGKSVSTNPRSDNFQPPARRREARARGSASETPAPKATRCSALERGRVSATKSYAPCRGVESRRPVLSAARLRRRAGQPSGVAHRLEAMGRAQFVRAPSIGSDHRSMPAMRGRVLRAAPGGEQHRGPSLQRVRRSRAANGTGLRLPRKPPHHQRMSPWRVAPTAMGAPLAHQPRLCNSPRPALGPQSRRSACASRRIPHRLAQRRSLRRQSHEVNRSY